MARPRQPQVIQSELDELRAKRTQIGEDLDRLVKVGEDEWSEGEAVRAKRLMAGYDRKCEEIGDLETELSRALRVDMIRSKARDSRNTESGDGSGPAYIDRVRRSVDGDVMRSNGLRQLESLSRSDDLGRSLSTATLDHLDTLIRRDTERFDGSYVAERLLLTENDAYRSAFRKYISAGMSGRPLVLSADETDAVDRFERFELRRAMSENTTTAGGFGVPVLIDSSIIVTSGAADVPLLSVCRIEQVTNNLWKGVSSSGMVWSYDTEAAEVSDDSVTLAQPSVTIHMARGYLPYSIEVSQDYGAFASEMGRLIDQGYQDLLAQKTMTGSGTGEPFGVFTALDANTNVEIVTTTDGSFGGPDIFKVWNALPERYRSRSTWIMSVSVQSAIRQFASVASATSAYFTIDLTGGTFRINDRPVITTDYAPSFSGSVPGTTGAANILAVGAWNDYLWAQRAGMSVETVQHVLGSNRRPTGERALFCWARNGGDMVNDLAARLLQNQ